MDPQLENGATAEHEAGGLTPGPGAPGPERADRIGPARLILWLSTIPFTALAVILLLSDRAPDFVERAIFRLENLGRRVEYRFGIDWVDVSDFPLEWRTAGHVLLWAGAAALAHGLFAHRVSTWRIAGAVLVLAIASEIGQVFFTWSRELEVHDVLANASGILIGTVGAMMAARASHALFRRRSLTG